MKKMIALAMTLLMICGLFAGCGQKSAYQTVAEAVAKTQALESVAVTMEMETTISSESMTISMPITMRMKGKDIKSENPTVLTDLTLSMLGQTMNAQIYQENGWSYAVIGEEKYKTQSEAQTDQYDYSEEMLQIIPEELMKGVTFKKGADGVATATVTIPGEKFTQVYGDLVDSLSSSMESVEVLTVKDAEVKISVAEGYISAYDMTFAIETSDGEEISTLDVKASIVYENPGKPVEITPPEGYQDFPES